MSGTEITQEEKQKPPMKSLFNIFCSCPETTNTHSLCCEGCEKPGLGSPEHNPYDETSSDCALLCCPCAFLKDLFTYPYRVCFKYREEEQ